MRSPQERSTCTTIVRRPGVAALGRATYHCALPLFQRVVDRGEFGVELRADRLHADHDGERDEACDQAIFDRGGPGLVAHESSRQPPHRNLPPSAMPTRG